MLLWLRLSETANIDPRSLSSRSKHLPLSDLPICLNYFSSARRHDSPFQRPSSAPWRRGQNRLWQPCFLPRRSISLGTRCRHNWPLILTLCFYVLLNVTSKLTYISSHSNPSHGAVFPRLQFVFITDIWRVNSCVIIIIIRRRNCFSLHCLLFLNKSCCPVLLYLFLIVISLHGFIYCSVWVILKERKNSITELSELVDLKAVS